MASRGILYIVWSNYNPKELQKSIDSLRPYGYDYHVAEIEDEGIGLAHKARMYDLSPFDTTLYLDTDCTVMGNLDYGFEMAEEHGIACCIAPASDCRLASKELGWKPLKWEYPQYNTGVVFFSKISESHFWDTEDSTNAFKDWKHFCELYPLSSKNDQPAFSLGIMCFINPYILPRNWNYRAKIRYEAKILHGPVKILHSR